MARKGRKTRWRKLPIPIGNNQGGEACCAPNNVPNNLEPEHPSSPSPKEQVSRVTFNEDEYTKITTPRQDMLFKKGYLSKKKPQPQEQQYSYTSPEPSHSPSESVESEQYVGYDDGAAYPPPFVCPSGYMDPNGLFYLNGGSYEVYDPYTNSVTVIYGPGSGYPGQPVLTAVPCHPVPLQPIEWFPPPPQHQQNNFKKRNSTDSQHWGSSQSCESPSSGHEQESQDSSLFYPQPQYVYPGYMFGAPVYNMNGVSVQGAQPPQHHSQHQSHVPSQHQTLQTQHAPQQGDQPKRRKKRRKRRRPGMGDDGSESSCEEVAGSGVSSDAGQGSSCSKTTDSGIHTGADSPQPQSSPVPHDISSPPPEVSTEEEPSQPSISHIPCLDSTNHIDSSSTEDETNQLHDSSIQNIISQTDNIYINQVNGVQDSEPEEKEHDKDEDNDEICIPPLLDKVSFLEEPSQSPSSEESLKYSPLTFTVKESSLTKSEESVSRTPESSYLEECIISDTNTSSLEKSSEIPLESFNQEESSCSQDAQGDSEPQVIPLLEDSNCAIKSIEHESLNFSLKSSTEERIECTALDKTHEIITENLDTENSLNSTTEVLTVIEHDTIAKSSCFDQFPERKSEIILAKESHTSSIESLSVEETLHILPESPVTQDNAESNTPVSVLEPTISTSSSDLRESHEIVNQEILDSHRDINLENIDIDDQQVSDDDQIIKKEVFKENASSIVQEVSDDWLNALEQKEETDSGEDIVDIIPILEEIPKEVICFTSESPLDSPLFKDEATLFEFKGENEDGIAEETGYSEEGWGSAEETGIEERWAMAELGEEVTVDKPITEAVTRWLESQGTKALVPQPHLIESEDEGIGEETSSPTGSKNVKGNPFLVQYPSMRTRVANKLTCENEACTCAWRNKCDPMLSVNRYYRLGAESPPFAPSFKTVTGHHTLLHLDPSLPFPCGLICCILQ